MTDYTPTTGAVRAAYTRAMRQAFIASTGEHIAEFDRWLKQVQADAWDVGYGPDEDARTPRNNPYREDDA